MLGTAGARAERWRESIVRDGFDLGAWPFHDGAIRQTVCRMPDRELARLFTRVSVQRSSGLSAPDDADKHSANHYERPATCSRQAESLGQHPILFQTRCGAEPPALSEPVVDDHSEAFIGCQDRAFGIGTAVGANSRCVYDIDPAPQRGSGRRPDRMPDDGTTVRRPTAAADRPKPSDGISRCSRSTICTTACSTRAPITSGDMMADSERTCGTDGGCLAVASFGMVTPCGDLDWSG